MRKKTLFRELFINFLRGKEESAAQDAGKCSTGGNKHSDFEKGEEYKKDCCTYCGGYNGSEKAFHTFSCDI